MTMTTRLPLLTDDPDHDRDEAGFGALETDRGMLPLEAMAVLGRVDGLLAQVSVRQTFVNVLDAPLEATYIFPLPDRAAMTKFRMEVAGRVVEGTLQERGQARREYDEAIASGHRAGIAEEERPGVFTLRVGNLAPGERATVELTLAGPLPFDQGEVTFRFPLVVAPRYIPGVPLAGPSVGDGTAVDTDAVPDASRITPPVLLPGFKNPVRLSLAVDVHESVASVGALRSSLHAVVEDARQGYRRVTLQPGQRLDRDFILRFSLGSGSVVTALSIHPDASGEGPEGTFALTVVPPSSSASAASPSRPRDVVFVLDRSGSMGGWKMVAARRALARLVDTLSAADRFHVLAFDDVIESPPSFAETSSNLVAATDRRRFQAVEFLAGIDARRGTEMAAPLERAANLLRDASAGRDRVLVLITDGQVGNEDQLLKTLASQARGIRVFAIGIDHAVNEGFLRRLAELGGGSYDLVESEDRLDEVMDAAHRRIGSPVLTGVRIAAEGSELPLVTDTLVPERLPDLFASAPVLVLGRYRGSFPERVQVEAVDASGERWSQPVATTVRDNPAIAAVWARGQVRKLEDRFVVGQCDRAALENEIVATSLRFGVLCRFTAYVAVDRSEVVNEGGALHRITQPVELPQGWQMPVAAAMAPGARPMGVRVLRSHGGFPSNVDGLDCLSFAPAPASVPPGDAFDTLELKNALFGSCFESTAPCPVPDPLRPRVLSLLTSLRQSATGDVSARVKALRTLLSELKALRTALKATDPTAPALATVDALLDGLRRFLRQSARTEAEVAEHVAQAASLLAGLAGVSDDEQSTRASETPQRDGFWK